MIPVHIEIPVQDLNRAKAFYEEVFGYDITDISDQVPFSYAMIDTKVNDKTEPLGGLMSREDRAEKKGISEDQGITNYMIVPSIADATAKVKEMKGEIITPITDVKVGKFAVCKDTEGNIVALWEKAKS